MQVRLQALHAIEEGGNETAAIADLISVAVLRRHLETMDRLDIEYDFLPRESEILHLHFWDAAFAKLKEGGVIFFESEGKNKGCWVMRRAGTSNSENGAKSAEGAWKPAKRQVAEEDQKVIVRSNGTVGYVGKDIAYHLWKFGLLGRDFGYRKFYRYPNGRDCWISTAVGALDHPHFGGVAEIYNVIDARQSEAQNTVIEALRGLGYNQQADHYTHFSYEMVALTPRCAAELGYQLSEEDKGPGLYRSLWPQGFWGKGRRSSRPAYRLGEKRSGFSAIPQLQRSRARDDRAPDCRRRAALLHVEVHQVVGDCVRLQGCVELRRRDRTVRSICGGARRQHLPQGWS